MNIPLNLAIVVNIIVLLIYVVLMFLAYKNGFIYSMLSLVFTLFSFILAWIIAPCLTDIYQLIDISKISGEIKVINELFNLNYLINTIIYFVLIIIAFRIIYFIVSIIFKAFNNIPFLGSLNRILGLVVGFIHATIIVILLGVLLNLPIIANGQEIKNNTVLKYIEKYSNIAIDYLIDNIDVKKLKTDINQFDIEKTREYLKEWFSNKNE